MMRPRSNKLKYMSIIAIGVFKTYKHGRKGSSSSTIKPNQVKHGLEPNCKRASADEMKEQFWSKGWALQHNGTKSNQKNWRGLNVESKPTINACCSPPQDATFQRRR